MRIACPVCEFNQDVVGLIQVEGGFGFECAACGARPVLAPLGLTPLEAAPLGQPTESSLAPSETQLGAQSNNPLISLSDPEPEPPLGAEDGPSVAAEGPPVRLVAPASPRPPPGQVSCPKCGHWQADPAYCHRCGLDLVRAARGELALAPDPLVGHRLAHHAQAAWDRIGHDLEDEAGHRGFIALCAEHGLLEFAGQCYRRSELALRQARTAEAAEGHPADHAAQARREQRLGEYRQRVIQAATARIGSVTLRERGVDPLKVRRWLLVAALALLFLGFAVGVYLFSRYQNFWLQNG